MSKKNDKRKNIFVKIILWLLVISMIVPVLGSLISLL